MASKYVDRILDEVTFDFERHFTDKEERVEFLEELIEELENLLEEIRNENDEDELMKEAGIIMAKWCDENNENSDDIVESYEFNSGLAFGAYESEVLFFVKTFKNRLNKDIINELEEIITRFKK